MDYNQDLNEFNQLVASSLSAFLTDNNMEAFQDDFETLFFSGPKPNSEGFRTQVTVILNEDVKGALDSAEPGKRLEMMENLARNLGTQIKYGYNKNFIGRYAKKYIGTMAILNAYDE